MGYNLYIGEAELVTEPEERHAEYVVQYLDGKKLGAPLNSSGDRSNSIGPRCDVWHDAMRRFGLSDLFPERSDPESLFRAHPGCAVLSRQHVDRFRRARETYRPSDDDDSREWDRRRLDWLVWWGEWALANCERPSFYVL